MHAVDLTTIATIADLHCLVEDIHAEIARRESQARDQALAELEVLAQQYGKTVESFLNLNIKPKQSKVPTKKRPPRKPKTLEEATAELRLMPRDNQPANGTPSS